MLIKFKSTTGLGAGTVFGYVPEPYRKTGVMGFCSVIDSNGRYISGECSVNSLGQITQTATESGGITNLFCIFDYCI